MPDLMTGKPIALVRVEGTLADRDGLALSDPYPGVLEKLKKLQETHFILLASPLANVAGSGLMKALFFWIKGHDVPYDDVHATFGTPDADVVYDNKAMVL